MVGLAGGGRDRLADMADQDRGAGRTLAQDQVLDLALDGLNRVDRGGVGRRASM